jgi:predicted RNA-binding Zn-ribbon protein involved in translation (DUF1610 family)
MNCSHCGIEVTNKNNQFCPNCGNELNFEQNQNNPKSSSEVDKKCPQCNNYSLSKQKKGFFSGSQKYLCSNCGYEGPMLLEDSALIAWGTMAVISVFIVISLIFGGEGSLGILGIMGIFKYFQDNKYRKNVNEYRENNNLPKYQGKEKNGLFKGILYAILIIGFTFGIGALVYGNNDLQENRRNSLNDSSYKYNNSEVDTASSNSVGNSSNDSTDSKESLIKELVSQLKSEMTLPQKIDEYTTLTNITAHSDAIRYHYTLSGLDVSDLTNSDLKSAASPGICSEESIKFLLEEDIDLEYSYIDSSSNETFFFTINKKDC